MAQRQLFLRRALVGVTALALILPLADGVQLLTPATPAVAAAGDVQLKTQLITSSGEIVPDTSGCGSLPAYVSLGTVTFAGNVPDQGTCSFERAYYKSGEKLLELKGIKVDGDKLILIPVVSAAEAVTQRYIELSLAVPANRVFDNIILQFINNKDAIRVSLDPQGAAASLLQVNGKTLSSARVFRANKVPNSNPVSYYFEITASMPRERRLDIQQFSESSDATANGNKFRVVEDTSTPDVTTRRYGFTVTNPANVNTIQHAVMNLGTTKKTVSLFGWMGQSHVYESGANAKFPYESEAIKDRIFDVNSDDCGAGLGCGVESREVWAADWVRDETGAADQAANKVLGSHPFFYSVLSTAAGTAGKYDLRADGSRDLTYFGRRFGFDGAEIPSANRIPNDKYVYWSGWDDWKAGYPAYNTATTPTLSDVNNTDGANFNSAFQPVFKAQNWMPQRVRVQDQNYGSDKRVEFYAQYAGVSPAMTGVAQWGNDKYPTDNTQGYSWFLDRVRLNGEWYPIPFPELSTADVQTSTIFDTAKSDTARSRMLGAVKSGTAALPFPMEEAGNGAAGFAVCGKNYSPRLYAKYVIDDGVNAGTTLKVELVNARTAGDYRADGYSASWSNTSERKQFYRQKRNSPVWFDGPAMQLLDNTACSGRPISGRNILQNNQWKTMYKITVEGMAADSYDLGVAWGITSQGFFANAGGRVLDNSQKISVKRPAGSAEQWTELNPMPKQGDGSNPDRLTRSQISDDGDNVRFQLRDGFINPVLRATTATVENVDDPAQDDSIYYIGKGVSSLPGAERSFSAKVDLPLDAGVTASVFTMGLSRSGYISVDADEVQLPVIYLQNSISEGNLINSDQARNISYYTTSTKPVVAGSDTVPEQWTGTNLTPSRLSKGAYAWQLVSGGIPANPDPESDETFVGYQVYGVKFNPTSSTGFNDAVAKTVSGTVPAAIIKSGEVPLLSPQDVLDISKTQIRLSNDAATDRRFDAVWLAPVFGNGIANGSNTYTTEFFNSKTGSSLGAAFPFVGAPGLTAKVTSLYNPPAQITRNGSQLTFVATNPASVELSSTTVSGIRFNYQPEDLPVVFNKKWVVNGTDYVNGAQPQQLQASLSVNDTAENWGVPTSNTQAGSPASFVEVTDFDPKFKGCTLDDVVLVNSTTGESVAVSKEQTSTGWKVSAQIGSVTSSSANTKVTDTVSVSYAFASTDAQRVLPAEVLALLNPGGAWPASATYASTVAAPNLSKLLVEATDNNGVEGTWLFNGWDQMAKTARGDVSFTGEWEFVPTRNLRAVTYDYGWAADSGLTDRATLPWNVLPSLPATVFIGQQDALPGAPAQPAPGNTVTDAKRGTFTFAGWRETATGYVGEWMPPTQSNVRYELQIVDKTGQPIAAPAADTKAYKWLTGTAPAAATAPAGTNYTMPLPKSVVVTIRNQASTVDPADQAPFTPDWNDWGTFLFKGYDYATQTADGSDLTFTAKWEWRPREWFYEVGVKHVSTTAGVTPSDSVLAAMQNKFSPANRQVADGSGWTSPAGGADITVADPSLGGTWKLLVTEPASYTGNNLKAQLDPAGAKRLDNGETITIGEQRTVDGENVRHYAPVTAKWEFTPNSTPGAVYVPGYRFEDSANSGTQLPADVLELLTGLPAPEVVSGETFLAPQLRRYVVDDPTDNRYYWLFNGWDAAYKVSSGDDFTFLGKWTKTAKVPGKQVSGYMWAWQDGTNTGLPANELPVLPAFKLVDAGTQTPDYPTGIAANQVFDTSAGKLRLVASVAGSGDSVGVRTLQLQKPATHSIKYGYDVVDSSGNTLLRDSGGGATSLAKALKSNPSGMEANHGTLDERLLASLPAQQDGVAEGQAVRPASIKNAVVDVRGESWNYGQWGSFHFVGWESNSVTTMGTSDVRYVAKFEWTPSEWWRGVQVKHRSLTSKFGSTEKLSIPAAVRASMAEMISPAQLSVRQSSSSVWTVPNLDGRKVADPSNNGTWRFKGFKWVQNAQGGNGEVAVTANQQIRVRTDNAQPTLTEFPRIGTDDSTWVRPFGEGASSVGNLPQAGNRNLQMVAEWELETSPVFAVTNTVTCNSKLRVQKAIGDIADAVPGVADSAVASDFEVRMTDPAIKEGDSSAAGKDYWGYSGELEVPGRNNPEPMKTDRQNIVNQLRKIDVLEVVPSAGGKPTRPEYIFQGWECSSGELGAVDEQSTRATVHYGLGQNVHCTVKNTAAQLTILPVLLEDGQFKALPDSAPRLAVTPDAAGEALGLTTKVKSSLDVVSSVNNTVLVRPRTKYMVTAGNSGARSVLRYERYTGSNPNDPNILTSKDWEPVGTTPDASLEPGSHAVYRAVYTPYNWRPELPLTGGWASDLFLILGGVALLVGVLGAAVHRERRRRAEEVAL